MATPDKNTLQTLDRALTVLRLVAEKEGPTTVTELAEQIGVHRTICFRIITTLAGHGLVTKDPDGNVRLGSGIVDLAGHFLPHLQGAIRTELKTLARLTTASAFLAVAEGNDCVALQVEEPRDSVIRAAYREGSRHPLSTGAAGKAILLARPPLVSDSEELKQFRKAGYALTKGELQAGAVGMAIPLLTISGFEASIGLVAFHDIDVQSALPAMKLAAATVNAQTSRQTGN